MAFGIVGVLVAVLGLAVGMIPAAAGGGAIAAGGTTVVGGEAMASAAVTSNILILPYLVIDLIKKSSNTAAADGETSLPNQGTVTGDVEGAPPVDAGQQGKHVPGHNNDKDPTKSKWKEGETGVNETQEAWMVGKVVRRDGRVKIHDFNKPIGPNGETRVKVHIDSSGNIHGYPVK